MKILTTLGWIVHAVGLILVICALVDETWLVRDTRQEHQGVFRCCPAFTCDDTSIQPNAWKVEGVDAVIGLLILGLLLAVTGGLSSVLMAACTWRNERHTFLKLVYGIAVMIGTGGLFLFASAITYVTVIPKGTKEQMDMKCPVSEQPMSYDFETGSAFQIFIAGSTAFCVSALLIFFGAPRIRKPVMRGDIVDPTRNNTFEIPLDILRSGSAEENFANRQLPSAPSFMNVTNRNVNGNAEHFSHTESSPYGVSTYVSEHSHPNGGLPQETLPGNGSLFNPGDLPSYSDVISDNPPPYTPRFATHEPAPPYTENAGKPSFTGKS